MNEHETPAPAAPAADLPSPFVDEEQVRDEAAARRREQEQDERIRTLEAKLEEAERRADAAEAEAPAATPGVVEEGRPSVPLDVAVPGQPTPAQAVSEDLPADPQEARLAALEAEIARLHAAQQAPDAGPAPDPDPAYPWGLIENRTDRLEAGLVFLAERLGGQGEADLLRGVLYPPESETAAEADARGAAAATPAERDEDVRTDG